MRIHCFSGCGSEDVIRALGFDGWADLLKESDDLTPMTAPAQKRSHGRGDTPLGPLPTGDALTRWCERLLGTPPALEQLERVRAWSPEILAYLGVGLAFSEEIRAFSPNYQGRPRVTIPVRDARGELGNVVFYAPDPTTRPEREPKTLALSGRPRDLFPSPEFLTPMLNGYKTIFLVEGEPDAITGLSRNLPCVSVPGVSAWKDEWTTRLRGHQVFILFDNDPAGMKAAERIEATLKKAEITVVTLKELFRWLKT